MALRTTEDEDSANNPGQADYDQKFGGLAKAEEEGTVDPDSTPKNTDGVDSSTNARESESNPSAGWINNTGTGTAANTPSGQPGFLIAAKRKKGPLIGILLTLLVGGGGAGFFLGPALAPIAFFENITSDLNDQLGAMNVREGFVFRNKLPSTDKKQALKGCSTLSIRCKFATIDTKQAARLKASGIEPIYDKTTGVFNNRIKPSAYKFQGVTYSSEDWAKQLKTNSNAIFAQRRANNMKFLGLNDPTASSVLERFGVSKKAPELKGKPQDRVNALMNRANAASPKDLKFTPKETNSDGTPKANTTYTLDGDPSGKTYTSDQVASSQKSIARITNAKPPSKVTKASIGALSILGYWDLACSIKNMLVAASVAAKVANQAELIQYVMPLASLADKIKAGDATPEDAQALGTFFSQPDSRQKIADITSSVTSSGTSGTSVGSIATKDNPNYGKNGMDSALYQMSSGGSVAAPSASRSQFSLGFGNNQLLSGISGFASIASIIVNLGDASVCHWVQNPLVRIAGTVVGVATAVGSGGASAIGQVVVAGVMMAAMMVLDSVINSALDGGNLINSDNLADAPVDRADAAWTGLSGLLGTSAQNRGLMPGNSADIATYAQVQNDAKQQYIALESQTANPLDINNQYSFLGSFARSLLGYSQTTFSPAAFLGNISSIVSGGMATLTKPYSAYAATIDQSRFKQCDDSSYKALGINADVQCNVRFIMPPEDLALDTDDVAKWMEDNNFVAKDTTTGLPVDYTPLQPKQSQGATMDFITGAVDGAVNSLVSTRVLSNDYSKFLDYCVYRTLPFGETGEEDSALGAAGDDWKSGAKCMTKGGEFSYFRIYTLDKSIQAADDDDPTSSTSSTAGGDIVGDLTQSSVSVACAPGTTDGGVVDGYYKGTLIPTRLCHIPGTVSSDPSQTDGQPDMMVNSRISGVYLNLVNKMKTDLGLSVIKVSDSFRSNTRQAAYHAASYNGAAAAGYSNHQLGVAVDFQMPSGNSLKQCVSVGGKCELPGDKIFDYLNTNAATFKLQQLSTEYWHWQPGGLY